MLATEYRKVGVSISNLSQDISSWSDIMPCIKITKSLLVYIFSNIM